VAAVVGSGGRLVRACGAVPAAAAGCAVGAHAAAGAEAHAAAGASAASAASAGGSLPRSAGSGEHSSCQLSKGDSDGAAKLKVVMQQCRNVQCWFAVCVVQAPAILNCIGNYNASTNAG
jgi:hypothetical protein